MATVGFCADDVENDPVRSLRKLATTRGYLVLRHKNSVSLPSGEVTYSTAMQELDSRTRSRVIGIAVYSLLCLLVLIAYSSWNRPLWYDEVQYFVLGSLGSTGDVLAVIHETTPNVNQGQTGAYMLVEYWSLSLFGAHLWVARLPSLLFGIYFLAASAVFLRGRQVPWAGVWAFAVLLFGQQTLMYFVGEGRTYMPLAAAVVGLLAYYFIPREERRRIGPRVLGWSAVLIGVTFHPYFAAYWPAILIFAAAAQSSPLRNLVEFANPALVSVGASIFFLVGFTTWLQGTASKEDLDPYYWLGDELWRAIPAQLFQWIYVNRVLIVIFGLLVLALIAMTCRTREAFRETLRRAWPPVALVGLAVTVVALIALISLQQGYWIIPRQWVASIALASIGVVWFLSVMIKRVHELSGSRPSWVAAGVAGVVIAASAADPALRQWNQLNSWSVQQQSIVVTEMAEREDLASWTSGFGRGDTDPWNESEWVLFANANARRGGDVWPEFRQYYESRDWDAFALRD